MSGESEFLGRFNLSDPEIQTYKPIFDELQARRAKALKAEYPREVAALKNKRVLFIGDSITSDNLGYRISVTLAANLGAVNGSVSSATSSTLLARSLESIEHEKPEIVSIMIGTNDSLSVQRPGLNQVPLEEYASNMKKILSKAKECGARVLLFAIPLVEEKLFSSCFNPKGRYQNNETVAVYNATLRQIADEEQITVFEHFWLAGEDLTEFFEPDGVHLSIKAQELFAKAWLVNATKFI